MCEFDTEVDFSRCYCLGTVGPWGLYEQHISSDIVLAVMQYHTTTHNKTWLRTVAWPIVSGVADFWASRVTYNTSTMKYDIRMVMGPDEFAWPVK